jgi:hypothetical protein
MISLPSSAFITLMRGPGPGGEASRFPAFPLDGVALGLAFSYQLSAVSFMYHHNWLYYSSKSIVIDPI